MYADGGAERRVKYITSFKKQMIGPKEAQCIETYRCSAQPDSAWQVDVTVQTPKVSLQPFLLHSPLHLASLRSKRNISVVSGKASRPELAAGRVQTPSLGWHLFKCSWLQRMKCHTTA